MNTLNKKKIQNNIIEEFNRAIQNINNYFAEIVNNIEQTIDDETLTCKEKIRIFTTASDEFKNSCKEKLQQIAVLSDRIKSFIDSFDMKQTEDQVFIHS